MRFDLARHPEEGLRMLRWDVVDMAQRSAHVASALSCLDMLAAVYFGALNISPANQQAKDRDRFILSKGHAAMALYAVLARAGFFDPALLQRYCDSTCCLAEHPMPGELPGVELAAGSLGHGLAFGAGLAYGLRLQSLPARVFVLLGDGECDEGSVWEAAAAARAQGLDNLTALVDWNGYQACGRSEDISPGLSLPAIWSGFGWETEIQEGHNFQALVASFARANAPGLPRVILCRTIKGGGVDFMEGDLEWHYRPVRGADRERARRRLCRA